VTAAASVVAGVHAREADTGSARSNALPLPLRRQLPHQRDGGDLGAENGVTHDPRQRRHGVAFSLVLDGARRFVSHLVFTHERQRAPGAQSSCGMRDPPHHIGRRFGLHACRNRHRHRGRCPIMRLASYPRQAPTRVHRARRRRVARRDPRGSGWDKSGFRSVCGSAPAQDRRATRRSRLEKVGAKTTIGRSGSEGPAAFGAGKPGAAASATERAARNKPELRQAFRPVRAGRPRRLTSEFFCIGCPTCCKHGESLPITPVGLCGMFRARSCHKARGRALLWQLNSGHDHDHGHDLLRLSRDLGCTCALLRGRAMCYKFDRCTDRKTPWTQPTTKPLKPCPFRPR
jgi:hypothetical protein